MKRKAAVLVVAALLLVGMTQVGFAAVEENGTRFKEACLEILANLSPEQQEQVEEAREDFREQMEALREEFHTKRAALRGEFLETLPEEVRSVMEERMAAREERQNGKRNGNCYGCHSEE